MELVRDLQTAGPLPKRVDDISDWVSQQLRGCVTASVAVESFKGSMSPRLSGEREEHAHLLAGLESSLPQTAVHRSSMRVIDYDGSEADAFVIAVRLNAVPGRPLSVAERTAAPASILVSHPQCSDRMIAPQAGIAHATVAAIRGRTEHVTEPDRIRADGRARPVDTAKRRMSTVAQQDDGAQAGRAAERSRPTPDPLPAGRRMTIVRDLRTDPSVRFSETGMRLHRWLETCPADCDALASVIAGIPPHRVACVAMVARAYVLAWENVAQGLDEATGHQDGKAGA